MALKVNSIDELMLTNETYGDILTQINTTLKKLIENDKVMINESTYRPKIWECKWMNDDTIEGYEKGYSVWVNADSVNDIVKTKSSEISTYIVNNTRLSKAYEKINKEDSQEVNAFFVKAVNGFVDQYVPPIYFLGNLTEKVQIRTLSANIKGGCKTLPTSDEWMDFYHENTKEHNVDLLMNALSSAISVSLDEHVKEYHLSGLAEEDTEKFIEKSPLDIDKINKQYFINHKYTLEMKGFDFIREFKQEGNKWYRLWNSGYLEQGGFTYNYGEELIEVTFMMSYDYSRSANFYQAGFKKFNDQDIDSILSQNSHYCITVTPSLKTQTPYASQLKDYSGVKLYDSVDVCKYTNNGFSIVNTDTTVDVYDKFNYYVCGYTMKTIYQDYEQIEKGIYKVDFIDTHG